MKIGIVTENFYPLYGGIAENVYYTCLGLKRLGHQVKVITSSGRTDGTICDEDIIRIGLSIPILSNGSIARITVGSNIAGQVKRTLKDNMFDILHIHQPLTLTLPFLALKHSYTLNVGTFHSHFRLSLIYRLFGSYIRRYFDKLDGKIAVSEAARDSISRYFPGEYEIIPNGVDLGRFDSSNSPTENDDDRHLNILFVGRLEPRKGLKYLLKAFPAVRREFSGCRLRIVGDGALRRYYKLFVDRRMRESISFERIVARDDLPTYYATSDILCAPAVRGESFGIVLLEGMASGKPIVASDIEGYRSVLSDGKEGLLVKPKDPQALSSAILSLLNDRLMRERLRQGGQRKVKNYSWDDIVRRIERYYRFILGRSI